MAGQNAQTHRVYLPSRLRDIIAELGGDGTGFVFSNTYS